MTGKKNIGLVGFGKDKMKDYGVLKKQCETEQTKMRERTGFPSI